MNFRVSDNSTTSKLASRINTQRSRLSVLQEQITSGKRINRASDDPSGAEAVIKLRTSQKEIEQFQRSAQSANQKLTAADNSLTSYESLVERVRTLVAQGLSDTTTQEGKNALATEIDSLRGRILNVANSKNGDDYLFGGTRQNAPPFNPSTAAPAATPTSAQYVQVEPGTSSIAVGVTADKVFSDATSDIFTDLTNAAAALRGTGNPTTDTATLNTTMSRLGVYTNLVDNAHALIGANTNATENAVENMANSFLSLDQQADNIEGTDFAQAALDLTATQQALEATLQVSAQNKRSLFDYLG